MKDATPTRSPGLATQMRDYLAIVIGITIYAIGFSIFILPHHIVIGGLTGFGTLVFYATGGLIPVAAAMYGTNIVLLLAGFRTLGTTFLLRTIFGATVVALEIGFMEGYFTTHAPIVTSSAMSIIIGAALMGLGIGIYYSHHGTTGGTDIVAAIMEKRSSISMGRVMMIIDVTIVASSFFLPFDGDLEARVQARAQTIIYGLLAILIYSWVADRYLINGRHTLQLFIISDHWERICYRITHETGRGVTYWHSKGYWTGTDREVLMVWCRKPDLPAMLRIVHAEDATAYVTISQVSSVYGNGFDHLRPTKSKD